VELKNKILTPLLAPCLDLSKKIHEPVLNFLAFSHPPSFRADGIKKGVFTVLIINVDSSEFDMSKLAQI
jgi:hypothetical protein